MLDKVKEYLYIDGNYEDTILNVFIASAQAYIESSLKDTSNVEKVRQDERYELLTLMLTAHFYNNRGVSLEQAQRTVPHGVYPMLQQLDMVRGEVEPEPQPEPVDPEVPVEYVNINGTRYELASRTATSITLAEPAPAISAPFINIDGVDYAYNGTEGRTVSFFNLSEYSILNENKTFHEAFKGYTRMLTMEVYILSSEDLTGKLVELFGTVYELTKNVGSYEYLLEEFVEEEASYDEEIDIYSFDNTRVGTVNMDLSNFPYVKLETGELSPNHYYSSAWGHVSMGSGDWLADPTTPGKLVRHEIPEFDFNTDYHIVDGSTIYKRRVKQEAHSFIYEGFEYILTNPRNYISHTIFDYVAVPYVEPEPEPEPEYGTVMNYDVYMDYQKATTVANRGYQLTGTGTALFDAEALTLTQPTFIVGLEQYVDYYASSPRLLHDTDNDVWYEATVQPHGIVQLTPATAPTLGVGTNYKPRISMVNSSSQVISVSTADARNYQFHANTGYMSLGFTPNRVPARLRSPDHTSTSAVLRYLTPVNGVQTELITHPSSSSSSLIKVLDFDNKIIGAVAGTVVDTEATLDVGTWVDYRAVYVDVPNQGIKNIVSYDPLTGVLVWE